MQPPTEKEAPKQAKRPFLNKAAHLVCYHIPEDISEKKVLISNQFTWDPKDKKRKEVPFTIKKAYMLCVPSGKKPAESPEPPKIPQDDVLDHFKCYQGNGGPGLLHRKVRLVDQFIPKGKEFFVEEPRVLCNPVEKTVIPSEPTATGARGNQEGQQSHAKKESAKPEEPHLLHKEAHLVCYPPEEALDIAKTVNIVNQLEPKQAKISTKRTLLLCVPSTKRAEEKKKP